MIVYRRDADIEPIRDLPAGEARGDQPQDLGLPGREGSRFLGAISGRKQVPGTDSAVFQAAKQGLLRGPP